VPSLERDGGNCNDANFTALSAGKVSLALRFKLDDLFNQTMIGADIKFSVDVPEGFECHDVDQYGKQQYYSDTSESDKGESVFDFNLHVGLP